MVRKAQILMMDLLEKNVGMQSRFLRPNVAKAKIRIGKKWYSHVSISSFQFTDKFCRIYLPKITHTLMCCTLDIKQMANLMAFF